MNVPEKALKEYNIKVNVRDFEFINRDNFSEITIKKNGLLSKEYTVLEGESVIGMLKHNPLTTQIYDTSGNVLLATIKKAEKHNHFDPKGIEKIREYLAEDATGNVFAKTVSEKAAHTIELIYNVVDESGVIAKLVPPQKVFGKQEYYLYVYSQKLQPIMLAALFLSIRMGEMDYANSVTMDAFYPF